MENQSRSQIKFKFPFWKPKIHKQKFQSKTKLFSILLSCVLIFDFFVYFFNFHIKSTFKYRANMKTRTYECKNKKTKKLSLALVHIKIWPNKKFQTNQTRTNKSKRCGKLKSKTHWFITPINVCIYTNMLIMQTATEWNFVGNAHWTQMKHKMNLIDRQTKNKIKPFRSNGKHSWKWHKSSGRLNSTYWIVLLIRLLFECDRLKRISTTTYNKQQQQQPYCDHSEFNAKLTHLKFEKTKRKNTQIATWTNERNRSVSNKQNGTRGKTIW